MSIDRIPLSTSNGSLWLCGVGDIAPDPDDALRRADDATTVVCLNEIGELDGRWPSYVGWLLEHRGAAALWNPMPDFRAPRADMVLPLLQTVVSRIESGDGVVMHCAMGQGRAGTLAVCVLMMLGADRDDALRTVASHRLFAGPGHRSQWGLVDEIAAQRS